MRQAVIVSTARTPIGRAFRGAFTLRGNPAGAQGFARQSALRAGLPDSVPAMSLDRQCSPA